LLEKLEAEIKQLENPPEELDNRSNQSEYFRLATSSIIDEEIRHEQNGGGERTAVIPRCG
jgi:hypothetical protein